MSEMELSSIYIGWVIQWAISVILCIIMLIPTIKHLCECNANQWDEEKHVILPIVKITSISYFLCYLLAFLLIIVELSLKLSYTSASSLELQAKSDDYEDIFWGLAFLFGGIANLIYYIMLIIRLYYTFKDTVYESSKYLYIAYILMMILLVIFGLCYIGSVISEIPESYRVIFIIITGVINLSIRISLIATFIYKLCKLIAETNAYKPSLDPGKISNSAPAQMVPRTSEQITSEQISFDHESYQLRKTITKYALLSIFAIVFTTIAVSMVAIERATRDRRENAPKFSTFTYFAVAILGISVWVEMICAYLGFNFNDHIYYRLCSKCHDGCCMSITDREVARMSSKMVERNSIKLNMTPVSEQTATNYK